MEFPIERHFRENSYGLPWFSMVLFDVHGGFHGTQRNSVEMDPGGREHASIGFDRQQNESPWACVWCVHYLAQALCSEVSQEIGSLTLVPSSTQQYTFVKEGQGVYVWKRSPVGESLTALCCRLSVTNFWVCGPSKCACRSRSYPQTKYFACLEAFVTIRQPTFPKTERNALLGNC